MTILAMCSGCASIVSSKRYPITLLSNPTGASVVVQNHKGIDIHRATTPTTIYLKAGRGYFQPAKYSFVYSQEGYHDSRITKTANVDGWYFGNFLFGGLVGFLIVDPLTGAMWRMNDKLLVRLSEDPGHVTTMKAVSDEPKTAAERLRDLKELHDEGLITREEYEHMRQSYLP